MGHNSTFAQIRRIDLCGAAMRHLAAVTVATCRWPVSPVVEQRVVGLDGLVAVVTPDDALRQTSERRREHARPARSVATHERPEAGHHHAGVARLGHEPLELGRQRRRCPVDGEATHEHGVRLDRRRVVDREVRVDEPASHSHRRPAQLPTHFLPVAPTSSHSASPSLFPHFVPFLTPSLFVSSLSLPESTGEHGDA